MNSGQCRLMTSDWRNRVSDPRTRHRDRWPPGSDRIAHQQAHAEALEDAQGGDADLAGADDAGGATVHVEADQPLQREVGVTGALIGFVDATVEGHHQAHRVLGDRFRGVGGHSHHLQPQLLGGGQIHVVVAAAQGDHLGAVGGQLSQHLAVGIVVDEQAHHGEAVGQPGSLGLQPHVEELQFITVLAVGLIEVLFVVALGTENGDSHGALSADNDVVKLQQMLVVITG